MPFPRAVAPPVILRPCGHSNDAMNKDNVPMSGQVAEQQTTDQQDFLHRLRHSLAHIMAQAVLEMRPGAKLAFGPPVDNGFYYDFDFQGNPIGEPELEEVENRMRRIIKEKQPFERQVLSFDEAVRELEDRGEEYKAEYARELVDTGKAEDGPLI